VRWTRKSRVLAAVALLSAFGMVGTVAWWAVLQSVPPPPAFDQNAARPAAPAAQSVPDEEATSPHHLPGSHSFADALGDLWEHRIGQFVGPPPRTDAPLARALDELLAGTRPLDTFALEVRWTANGRGMSATLFGDGLGIHWQGKQFRLSVERRLGLFRTLQAADFPAMPAVLGKPPDAPAPPDPSRPRGVLALRIGDNAKAIERGDDGPADEAFATLVRHLLECLADSGSGVGVDGLEDGLEKVLDQRLDARALQIEVRYLRHLHCYTLRIDGRSAAVGGTDYFFAPFTGRKTLTMGDLTEFIGTIRRDGFLTLPKWISSNFDFSRTVTIRVLSAEYTASGGNGYGVREPLDPKEMRERFLAVWRAADALRPESVYEQRR
jgi:hypothetical protein